MTRENKIGLAVCVCFLGLVGTVAALKMREPAASAAPRRTARRSPWLVPPRLRRVREIPLPRGRRPRRAIPRRPTPP